MSTSGKVRAAGTSLVLALALSVGFVSSSASAEPPDIPSGSAAKAELAELSVAADGSMDGYSREKFPHWHTVDGACDTRETVLKRDGDGVKVDSSCKATSGSWTSPYDGEKWTATGDVDIDHMVPLAAAWRSGASGWTTDQREAFANDLDTAQLWAVTDNVNQSKGDQTPDTWKPPLESFYCTYASAFTHVKHKYDLSVNTAEKAALEEMLATC